MLLHCDTPYPFSLSSTQSPLYQFTFRLSGKFQLYILRRQEQRQKTLCPFTDGEKESQTPENERKRSVPKDSVKDHRSHLATPSNSSTSRKQNVHSFSLSLSVAKRLWPVSIESCSRRFCSFSFSFNPFSLLSATRTLFPNWKLSLPNFRARCTFLAFVAMAWLGHWCLARASSQSGLHRGLSPMHRWPSVYRCIVKSCFAGPLH